MRARSEVRRRQAYRLHALWPSILLLLVAMSPVVAAPRPTCFGEPATIVGTREDDSLRGTAGRDVIVGLGGNDMIDGRQRGNDLLCGGSGNDLLNGGDGSDRLAGGRGKDFLSGGWGDDILDGGGGRDLASFYHCREDGPFGVHVDLRSRSARGNGRDELDDVEDVWGSVCADVIVGDRHRNRIDAGLGADWISGGRGNDYLAGDGDAAVDQAGADTIYGGAGDDHIRGDGVEDEARDDVLYGGRGDDLIEGDGSFWVPDEAAGRDSIHGGLGNDEIYGDQIFDDGHTGDQPADDRAGTSDLLHGDRGDDRMFGQGGDDHIEGGPGYDHADGGGDSWSDDTLATAQRDADRCDAEEKVRCSEE